MHKLFTKTQQAEMFRVARQSIVHFLEYGKALKLLLGDPVLKKKGCCFVTLKKDGQLRGCIGQLTPTGPLIESVQEVAIKSATKDGRFKPVTSDELASLDIEISVLSPAELVTSLDDIEMGKHGVIVKGYANSGIFLPQVATESGWDKETFLSRLCAQKAGLSADSWKTDPQVKLWRFTVDVYRET